MRELVRSTRSGDYQDVPRPVAVMAKDFPSGATTGRHGHSRAQLLYATAGLMVATTEGEPGRSRRATPC